MSGDFRRRRRIPPDAPRRTSRGGNGVNPWVITIAAAIVVIAGGWFLGQALAHAFSGPQPKPQQVAQVLPSPSATVQPSPSPAASATAAPSASPKPTSAPTPKPTIARTATPKPKPTPEPTPTASAQPTSAPTALAPVLRHTEPVARKAETTPSAAATTAPQTEGSAARVVRAYINALRGGDPATASTYLGNGVPDESFIDSATRIISVTQTENSDGSYKVSVDMQTAQGEYYETFTVASDKILDKTAIKP
jgi:outer membrane biosynthesis protein TonB